MKEIIKNYKNSEREIERISKERDRTAEKGKTEQADITGEYREKIRALENKRDKRVEGIEKILNAAWDQGEAEINELHKAIDRVERIAYFLAVDLNKDLTIKNTEVKAYRDRFVKSVGYIFDDLLLKIKVFIVENDKPKNKYSLVAFGRSVFGEPAIEFPYSYGLPTNESANFCLRAHIMCFPTIGDGCTWLEKRRGNLFKKTIEEYRAIKKEHHETINTYTIADLEPIISHKCGKCGKFLTKRQAGGWSLQDNKCPRCNTPGFAKKK